MGVGIIRPEYRFGRAFTVAAVCAGAVACANQEDSPSSGAGGSDGTGGKSQGSAAGGVDSAGGSATSGGSDSGGASSGGTPNSGGSMMSSGGASSGGTSGGGTSSGGKSSSGGAPNGSIALPYHEDFEDGAADGWLAGFDDQMMTLGKWGVVDDAGTKVYQAEETTSDPSWAVGGDYRWTDQHLEAKVKFVSGAADGLVTLVVRFTTFKTLCFVEVRDNQMKLRVKADGSTSDIGTTYKFPTPLVDGTWYTIGISAKGPMLAAYFDGMVVASGMNASVTSGGIALTATDAVVSFDDVTVTAP